MESRPVLLGCFFFLAWFLGGCSAKEENVFKVMRIHEVNKVCSMHDESTGVVVVLDIEGGAETRVCQFVEWDSTSMGKTYRGTRFVELKSYRHEFYPDYPYYRCTWP